MYVRCRPTSAASASSAAAGVSSRFACLLALAVLLWAIGPSLAAAQVISGTVFEDVNYGGGAGRALASATGRRLMLNAAVSLYDPVGNLVTSQNTDSNGVYSFGGLAAGNYAVRVASAFLQSGRGTSGVPVLTFRTDASSGVALPVTNRVGGEVPIKADFSGTGATLASMATATQAPNSITTVALGAGSVSGVDFGYNFNTVVNINNSGDGSLRQAVANANNMTGDASLAVSGRTAGIEHIIFMLPNGTSAAGLNSAYNVFVSGVATIAPTVMLPLVTSPLVIDAQTQPGWTLAPIVRIDGASAGAVSGITLTASGNTIRGLMVTGFLPAGFFEGAINVASGGSNVFEGNYIGTDGSVALGNSSGIVLVGSGSNIIGGASASQRNVIAGNAAFAGGVFLFSSNNRVQGNYIGTNAAGSAAVLTGSINSNGIIVLASGNVIGVDAIGVGTGNVISGNQRNYGGIGVLFDGTQIGGNLIGTDATGTFAIGNSWGIILPGTGSVIGGPLPAQRNVISGNGTGVQVVQYFGSQLVLQNNYIGTNINNTGAIQNNLAVSMNASAPAVISNNVFRLASHANSGLRILNQFSNPAHGGVQVKVSANSFYGSSGPAIDLTANGVIDVNTGSKDGIRANYGMNFPVFTAASLSGTTLTVAGYVGSAANQSTFATSLVEVFVSDQSSSNGAGRTYLGSLTANASGNFSGALDVSGAVLIPTDMLTATATDTINNTSEFGPNFVLTVVVTPPGSFNAFESATAAGAVTGVIYTKQAGTVPFTFAVVALNTDSSAVLTTFTGNVKVELVDASDSSGALSGNCRASWVPIAATTLSFAAGNAGRKNVSLSAADAYRDVRVRMSSPALGPPTLVSCSTDNFAVRPYEFANFSVTDGDWQSAGTARALDNAAVAGGVVHKAGQPFTLGATAVGDNGATTAGYNGSPTLTPTVCGGSACLPGLGALAPLTSPAATNGVLAGNTTYSEAGSFALQLVDTSFAAVDAADGSTLAERTIASPVINVGRFVPDHFEINPLAAPVLQTFGSACASRAFTYVGQPFGYATLPQATLVAKNAGGGTTANYQGALWPLSAANVGQSYAPTPAAPPLDVSGISAPTLASNGNGSGTIAGKAADKLSFTRDPLLAPLAPFAANIALTWSVSDASEAGVVGNGTITTPTPLSFANIGFDAGNELRFGVLHIASAYGSDLLDLPVPVEARYWNGVRWTTNAADHCTALSTSSVAMGTYQSNLAACETAISPGTLSLVNGRTVVKLARPGNGNTGSVDLTLQLASVAAGLTCTAIGNAASALSATAANLPWLQGKWSGASFNQNPTARASFGQFGRPRSPIIYQRENY